MMGIREWELEKLAMKKWRILVELKMEHKRHEQGDIWKGRETTGEKYLPAWHTAICPASSLEGQSWHLLLTLKCFHNLETCIFSWRTILKQRSCWPAEEDKMYLCLSLSTAESTQLGRCWFHLYSQLNTVLDQRKFASLYEEGVPAFCLCVCI